MSIAVSVSIHLYIYMYMYMFSITICAGEGCSATTMAVACLEQRNIPLVIAFNVVWSPWGLGRTSPFRFAPRPRRHSWGGFTTYAHFSRQGEEEKFRNKTVVAHLFNSADERQHRHLRKQNKQRHRRKKRTEKRERNAQRSCQTHIYFCALQFSNPEKTPTYVTLCPIYFY